MWTSSVSLRDWVKRWFSVPPFAASSIRRAAVLAACPPPTVGPSFRTQEDEMAFCLWGAVSAHNRDPVRRNARQLCASSSGCR